MQRVFKTLFLLQQFLTFWAILNWFQNYSQIFTTIIYQTFHSEQKWNVLQTKAHLTAAFSEITDVLVMLVSN